MKASIKYWSLLYIISLCLQIYLGINFDTITGGFVVETGGALFYCNQLLSSGGDDGVVFAILLLQIFPIIIRFVFINSVGPRWETYVYFSIIVLLVLMLSVPVECGDIVDTIANGGKRFALAILASILTSGLFLWRIKSLRAA